MVKQSIRLPNDRDCKKLHVSHIRRFCLCCKSFWKSLLVQKVKSRGNFRCGWKCSTQCTPGRHFPLIFPFPFCHFQLLHHVRDGHGHLQAEGPQLRKSRGKKGLSFLTRDSGSPALASPYLWLRVFLRQGLLPGV